MIKPEPETMDHAHIAIVYDIIEKQTHIMDRIKQIKDYRGGHELAQAMVRQKESIMWLDSWIDHTEDYE